MHHLLNKFWGWDGIARGEGGFIQAALMAAPYVLQGISALGAIIGKKKKYMDPETLRALYGPAAIGKDTQEIANQILNSPYGQQLMAQAAEQGQGLQTEMNARAAGAGLSPDTGGESGASTFATAAGTQAQTGLERQTKAGIYSSAMPIAADLVSSRMQAGLLQQGQQNADPSMWQRIAAAAGQTASSIPAAKPKSTAVAPPGSGLESLTTYMNQPANAALPGQSIVNAAAIPHGLPQLRPRKKLSGAQEMLNVRPAR